MVSLHLRMYMLLGLLFAILYAIMVMCGTAMGVGTFYGYAIFAGIFMVIQFMVGPKIVEWSMKIQYVTKEQYPKLFDMIEDQARRAKIPMPKVCVSRVAVPNAFAFGRGQADGRVCVTEGIMQLLTDEELKAVIGHEISHIKNRDVLTITILSVIPLIMYRLAWHTLFFGGRGRDRGNTALVGLAAFLFYFITNLLVLYASRIREYFADKGAIELGNRPEVLASALYKLVYGSARAGKRGIKEVEGFKAFFMNDPSRAALEINDLFQLDLDKSGHIDAGELAAFRQQRLNLTPQDKMLEALSTHPNMLKRIQHLASLKA
ncbi:MAG: M48 family metalloprotease [Candidatus Omnitrophica bacterium]|nr:M48 family metalloprotease [Candidatus Omnitrophota bacterium]